MRALAWMFAALLLSGCKDEPSLAPPPAPVAASDEALCDHGVQASVCPKHNPKLVAVFRAKGDWCEEHGFPMSFCPTHHPERGGRPAGEASDDGAPPHGTKVRFKTKDAAQKAGIATAVAEEREGGARLEVTATIAYDATRRAEVNARAAGVVRALKVDLGAVVTGNAPLAVIESAQVGVDRSRLDAATARVTAAQAIYQRKADLQAERISTQRDVDEAKRVLDEAQAERNAAASALGVVGARGAGSSYTVTSPLPGTVVKRNATIGHMVGVEEPLFEIVDTSTMWAEIDVPETQLASVAPGQQVVVTVENIPDRAFTGVIAYVAPEVSVATRTAKARVALANPAGVLRANMFARAEIALGEARPTVMVPVLAVQRAKGIAYVFVRLAEDQFEARRVTLGRTQGEHVEIAEGVARGETVATRGSFLLKTETLKGAIGAGCCD